MTKDEALKLALEALHKGKVACEWGQAHDHVQQIVQAMEAIKEALAQPEQEPTNIKRHEANVQKFLGAPKPKEQEPVAWMYQEYRDDDQFGWRDEILFTPPPNDPNYFRNIVPVYTTPPQRTWVGLTDEEIDYIYTGVRAVHHEIDSDVFARAIEAKLKDKNT